MGLDVHEPDEYFGDQAESIANKTVIFVFEILPIITIGAAILYLIWNVLDPVITF